MHHFFTITNQVRQEYIFSEQLTETRQTIIWRLREFRRQNSKYGLRIFSRNGIPVAKIGEAPKFYWIKTDNQCSEFFELLHHKASTNTIPRQSRSYDFPNSRSYQRPPAPPGTMQRISQAAALHVPSQGPEIRKNHFDKRLSDDLHLIDLHTTPAQPNPLTQGGNAATDDENLTPNPLLSPAPEAPEHSDVMKSPGAV